ncbi:D-alanyl-D-alanine carboxypeptidase family protein [Adlercreutzia sp. ZJ141]|uniref:D-alanyl-D-alanine carboxypeptidase family protein n=1 Tax=Adlercreutzia sp. ZJ141 TaxID=2709406 RepID=UPI001F14FCC0|nr:D-alanyl-D-alanine carboxypeptidase [Adlercreutzia sp. ZJ141]
MATQEKHNRNGMSFLARSLLSAALAIALVLPATAFADVRKADVVCGETVEARGLSVAQCPNIDAEYALVMGADGTVYFERNAITATKIASITKIMTAIVALDAVGSDSNGVVVTVSENAATVGESSAGLAEGDTMDFESALKALMVPSGNDAAVALAESLGDRCASSNESLSGYDRFVQAMNDKAAALGCTDTLFTNPHGLDFGEFEGDLHSCALDVAKITQHAMTNDLFRSIVSGGSTAITVTHADGTVGEVFLETTDEFLELYEYACGVKTGVTEYAGPSFVGAANKDGRELYAVAIGSSSEAQRFVDCQQLCEWVYEHEISYPLATSDEMMRANVSGEQAEVPVVARVAHQDWIDRTVAATLSDPDAAVTIFDLNGNVSQSVTYDNLTGNVHVGDKVGTITFKQRNNVIAEYDLVACEDVYAPTFIEGVKIWWTRLFNGFTGKPKVAESVTLNELPYVIDKTSNTQ